MSGTTHVRNARSRNSFRLLQDTKIVQICFRDLLFPRSAHRLNSTLIITAMPLQRCYVALVALMAYKSLAQTPIDFKPGSLVNLGVAYPALNISPVGSLLQSLDRKW